MEPETQPSTSSQNFWVLVWKKKQELRLMERNLWDKRRSTLGYTQSEM